jgi:hypothetical protein
MNNNSKSGSSRPNIDDLTLDRHLESLPGFDPFSGFEDRVMSRVLEPPPRWVQSIGLSVRSLIETRRVRWLAAGLMATSTISLIVATTFALTNFSTVSRGFDWMATTLALPIWRTFLGLASESARDAYAFSAPLLVSRDMALIASAAAVGVLAFSTLMLLCLMRPKCLARSE